MSVEGLKAAVDAERQTNTNVKAPSDPALAETKPAQDETLSPKFVALARREKALRKQWQEKEEALKAREEALKAKEVEYQSAYLPKSKLKSDPINTLLSEGLTYDDLTQAILNGPTPENIELRKIKEEIERVKESQTAAQKAAEEKEKKNYEQALNQLRTEAKLLVESNSDFEMIKETDGGVDAVVDLVEKTYKEEGRLISVESAAKEIEDYLVEDTIKRTQLQKIKSKLSPASEKKPEETKPQTIAAKTLTHSVGSTSKPLTAYERAVLAFKGELK